MKLPWWLSGKEPACQCSRCALDPWVGKIPWRRKWKPTPSTLAWRIPWTEAPDWLPSTGSQKSWIQWNTHIHTCTPLCVMIAKEENNRNIPKKGSQPHSLKFLKGKLGVHFLFPSFRDPFTNHPEDVKSHLKSYTHHTYSFLELLCRKR